MSAAEERLGSVLGGKLRLERVVGRGAMGVVFAGKHVVSGRPVAVKVLWSGPDGPGASDLRLVREARAAARIRHPNVVDVLDTGRTDDGLPYLVMELLEGADLGSVLAHRKRLDELTTVALLCPILDALDTLHLRGVLHRDLKPSNIFLAREQARLVPKILDFGIARLDDGAGTLEQPLGTPRFASPEQLRQDPLDARSDLWSVAAIAYACLCGRAPFEDETPGRTIARALSEDPSPLACGEPALRAVIDAALAKDPALRPARVAHFRRALREALGCTEESLERARMTLLATLPEPRTSDATASPMMTATSTATSPGGPDATNHPRGTEVLPGQRGVTRAKRRLERSAAAGVALVLTTIAGAVLVSGETPRRSTPRAAALATSGTRPTPTSMPSSTPPVAPATSGTRPTPTSVSSSTPPVALVSPRATESASPQVRGAPPLGPAPSSPVVRPRRHRRTSHDLSEHDRLEDGFVRRFSSPVERGTNGAPILDD